MGLIPSQRHNSLTVTSRRKPSRTMRIFSSEVYFLRVAARTCRTNRLVSSVRSSAAWFLSGVFWVTIAPFKGLVYPFPRSSLYLPKSSINLSSNCVPLSLTFYSSWDQNLSRSILASTPERASSSPRKTRRLPLPHHSTRSNEPRRLPPKTSLERCSQRRSGTTSN